MMIALRQCDFVCKITGRLIAAPTIPIGKLLAKPEFIFLQQTDGSAASTSVRLLFFIEW